MLPLVGLAQVACLQCPDVLALAACGFPKVRRNLYADVPCVAAALQVVGGGHALQKPARLPIGSPYISFLAAALFGRLDALRALFRYKLQVQHLCRKCNNYGIIRRFMRIGGAPSSPAILKMPEIHDAPYQTMCWFGARPDYFEENRSVSDCCG